MIEFDCPHCAAHIKVAAELAGRRGKCHRCGQPMVVPQEALQAAGAPVDDFPRRLDTPQADTNAAPANAPPSIETARSQSLEACQNCNELVSMRAATCPRCGCPIRERKEQLDHARASTSTSERTIWTGHPSMFRRSPILFLFLVLLVPIGVGAFGLALWWLYSVSELLTVTERRTILSVGLMSKTTSEIRHIDVRNIQVNQDILQRLTGAGSIGISSSGQAGVEIRIFGIVNPDHVAALIRNLQDGNRLDACQPRPAIRLPIMTFSGDDLRRSLPWLAVPMTVLISWLMGQYLPWLGLVSGLALSAAPAAYLLIRNVRTKVDGYLLARPQLPGATPLRIGCLATAGVILIIATIPTFRQRRQLAADQEIARLANGRVAAAVHQADSLFDLRQYDNAESLLRSAINDGSATETREARRLLQQIAEVKSNVAREQAARTALEQDKNAHRAADNLWESAGVMMRLNRFDEATRLMTQYKNHRGASNPEQADAILRALSIITSADQAVESLQKMSASEFVRFRAQGEMPIGIAVENRFLKAPLADALRQQIPQAEKMRLEQKAKIAKQHEEKVLQKLAERPKKSEDNASNTANLETSKPSAMTDKFRERTIRTGDGGNIGICANKAAYDRFTVASVDSDVITVAGLVGGNLVWEVNSGTKVRETKPGFITSEVLILEGRHKGKRGLEPIREP